MKDLPNPEVRELVWIQGRSAAHGCTPCIPAPEGFTEPSELTRDCLPANSFTFRRNSLTCISCHIGQLCDKAFPLGLSQVSLFQHTGPDSLLWAKTLRFVPLYTSALQVTRNTVGFGLRKPGFPCDLGQVAEVLWALFFIHKVKIPSFYLLFGG